MERIGGNASWPSKGPSGPSPWPLRRRRWALQSLTALVILAAGVTIRHTSGGAAATIVDEARFWLKNTVSVPHSASGWIRFFRRQDVFRPAGGAASQDSGSGGRWQKVVPKARLLEGFGWVGTGTRAAFSAKVRLAVPQGTAVTAGVGGQVGSVTSAGRRWTVTLNVGHHTVVTYGGLQAVDCHAGQNLAASDAIGVAGPEISLAVTVDHYPVNPLTSTYFGSLWVAR